MKETSDRLYNLLPAVYRMRDFEKGQPLRALMAVLEEEMKAIESDINGLYENWFIETCEDWVVPYIGDLLGVRGLHFLGQEAVGQRAFAANTLAYRRRKGTAVVIEQLARDVTGWPARVIEFFQLLATSQNLNHVRLNSPATPDFRDVNLIELVDGPFERAAHTVEIRDVASAEGKYNIPNVGIFLWRLQSYPMSMGTARHLADKGYTFSPLGIDAPLFNNPQTEMEITHLAEEVNVPGKIRRRDLAIRKDSIYFETHPAIRVFLQGSGEVLPNKIIICNLDSWDVDYPCQSCIPPGQEIKPRVAVDPELGRLVVLGNPSPEWVKVSYAYGFSDDIGGGPYSRQASVRRWFDPPDVNSIWRVGVAQDPPSGQKDPGVFFDTLEEAIDAWNIHAAANSKAFGLITIIDNGSYSYDESMVSAHAIELPPGSKLAIVAAGWPFHEGSGVIARFKDEMILERLRPHTMGDIHVKGKASDDIESPGELVLDGLLIEGKLTVEAGSLGRLRIYHTTLVPEKGGLAVADPVLNTGRNARLKIEFYRSICGPILASKLVPELLISDSIVGESGGPVPGQEQGPGISAWGTGLTIIRSTVFGTIEVHSLEAGSSIFTGVVTSERTQSGCIRFCCLPHESKTPRRFSCQPDLALKDILDPSARESIKARMVPVFTSVHYGDPGYAQLSHATALEVRTGAEDGSEMGVFSSLKQPQREANLRASMDEYLRFRLRAGLFYVD